MAEEISAHFRWTLPEVTEAARWHFRQSRARRIRLAILLILTMLCGVAAAFSSARFGIYKSAWLIAAAVYFLLLLGFVRWFDFWRVRRSFSRSTSVDTAIEWRLGDAGMWMKGPHGSSEVAWTAFNQAVITPKGLLFYNQPLIFHWLPKHAFATEADFAAATAFARAKIIRCRVLS